MSFTSFTRKRVSSTHVFHVFHVFHTVMCISSPSCLRPCLVAQILQKVPSKQWFLLGRGGRMLTFSNPEDRTHSLTGS